MIYQRKRNWLTLLSILLLTGWLNTYSQPASPLLEKKLFSPSPYLVIFIPDFEASALENSTPPSSSKKPHILWGNPPSLHLSPSQLAALCMPHALEAQPLLQWGQHDLGKSLIQALTLPQYWPKGEPPLTNKINLLLFPYDWRRDLARDLAPRFQQALHKATTQWAHHLNRPPQEIHYIIIAHGFGGLLARTFISQNPREADRIARLYLVATPNLGTPIAIHALLTGSGHPPKTPNSPQRLGVFLPITTTSPISSPQTITTTFPSLYQLLPIRDPHWVRDNPDQQEPQKRISTVDLLHVGTWKDFWPSPQSEHHFLHTIYPATPHLHTLSQKTGIHYLQQMLAQAREWRLAIGTLAYTDQLLTRPGQSSRLRLVVSRGIATPTGILSQGTREKIQARFTYGPFADGDGIVTVESAVDDLRQLEQVIVLDKIPHFPTISHPIFLKKLIHDLVTLRKTSS